MRLIVTVPYFNTPENRRHHCVVRVLKRLQEQSIGTEHAIVAVDNGSTDLRCWEWLSHSPEISRVMALRIEEPMSISQGVNYGWRLFESELDAGTALACKFDSDMVADDGWMGRVVEAIELHEAEMCEGIPLGMVGLLVQRHPDYVRLAKAPHLPGGLVKVTYLHGACVIRTPIAWGAIGYEKHPFVEEFLPKDYDPSLPWGRWGFGDHWTIQRLNYCNLWCGILADVNVAGIFGSGSISRQDKAKITDVASQSLTEMVRLLGLGKIDPHQPYDGPEM